MPLMSVLMCTNKIDEYLNQAIDSILQQSFDDYELVLVGNGLSAEDASCLQKYSYRSQRIRIILTDIRYLNFSLSLGVHHCNSDLVVRMDADDIAYPERLYEQYRFMETHPEISVCGSAFDLIDEMNVPFKRCSMPITDEKIRAGLYFSCPICHPTVIIRRSVLQNAAGYIGGLHAEDYDLWVRLSLNPAIKFANLSQPLLGYRAVATGAARYSKNSYASVSSAQWRSFVLTGNPMWFLGAIFSSIKRLIRAKQ